MVWMLCNSSDCFEIDVGIPLDPFWHLVQWPAQFVVVIWRRIDREKKKHIHTAECDLKRVYAKNGISF